MKVQVVHIHTDGACIGNPGPGGWGAILVCGETEKVIRGKVPAKTTNNKMELTAVIEGLKALKTQCCVYIHTDSQYIINGAGSYTAWMARPRTANKELWSELKQVKDSMGHKIYFLKTQGHSGELYNERCDKIAREQAKKAKAEIGC